MTPRVDSEGGTLTDLFRGAAEQRLSGSSAAGPARDLLDQLGYLNVAPPDAPHCAALLRAAAGFRRLFSLDASDAPGLVVLGAEVDPGIAGAPLGAVSGRGLSLGRAFETCVGEGVEYLSSFATPDDALVPKTDAEALAGASPALIALWDRLIPCRRDPGAARTAWVAAADLADGRPVFLPADLCLRRPDAHRDIVPPWPLGAGCGAGQDHLDATLHGLFELIERDAVALWWRGGHRARLVPGDFGVETLNLLRRGETNRRAWLLDITSDLGVPAVSAISCEDDGFGVCCGFASRATLAAAANAATMELAQMELAYRLTATKRVVRGDAALNSIDRAHIRRFTEIAVGETLALHPLVPPAAPGGLPDEDRLALLAALRHRLAAAGLAPCVMDLTREAYGIPAVRVVCPGLEAGLSGPAGPRLSAVAAASGLDPDRAPPL